MSLDVSLSRLPGVVGWNEQVQSELLKREPPLCECAAVGRRPLSWAPWIPGWSGSPNSSFDRANLEFSHQHIFWESSGHNVGFGPSGLFGEEREEFHYRTAPLCLDGSRLRRAIADIGTVGPYHLLWNNCQHFVARAMEEYRRGPRNPAPKLLSAVRKLLQ